VIVLLLKLAEHFHKFTSNNLHNYVVVSFLAMCILTVMSALTMTVYSWWKSLPPPPEQIFTLLEMELYALGTYASVNAVAHTTKALGGKAGVNTPPPVEPRPD
jgi:hypothetical protein